MNFLKIHGKIKVKTILLHIKSLVPMVCQTLFLVAGEMAEWSIASDLKSDELNRFREFESHSLLYINISILV